MTKIMGFNYNVYKNLFLSSEKSHTKKKMNNDTASNGKKVDKGP